MDGAVGEVGDWPNAEVGDMAARSLDKEEDIPNSYRVSAQTMPAVVGTVSPFIWMLG